MTQTTNQSAYVAAQRLLASGLSVIPVDWHTKKATGSWKEFQNRQATADEMNDWRNSFAFAVVAGNVSGGLELIDFDDNGDADPPRTANEFFDPWLLKVGHLVNEYHLPIQRTPGKGFQVVYCCPEPGVNQKLAWIPDATQEHGRSIAIETRGEGGYFLVTPSLHPSGGRYSMLSGDLAEIPLIPQSVRDELIQAARDFDEMPHTRQEHKTERVTQQGHHTGDGVIDAYNARHSIGDVLRGYGYTGEGVRLSRPNKPDSLGVHIDTADNVAFPWSSNDPLQQTTPTGTPKPVDPFAAYCLFEHNGDVKAAVKAAAGLLGMEYKNGNGPVPDEPPGWMDSEDDQTPTESLPPADLLSTLLDEQLAELESTPDAGADLADLLGELDAIGEDDRQAVTLFALDNVPTLAGMDKTAIATFCTHLQGRGVTAEWIRTSLRPAINEAKKEAQSGQPNGGGFADGATWRTYVTAAARLGYTFRLNDLSDTVEVNGARQDNVNTAILIVHLHEIGLKNADLAKRAFIATAAEKRYHPVKEYLAGVKWDGKDHISTLAEYFTDTHDPIEYKDGTKRTVFHAFLRRWLVGAVGKTYDPRQNQNAMLVLDGLQGSGKSYFAKWICPLPELHFEGAIKPDDKDYSGYVTNRFVWEVSELGATTRRANRESLKSFITQIDHTWRPSHEQYAIVKPALASFIGTVNFDGSLLNDTTGHRRFWPVTLAGLDWNYSRDVDLSQVWAHAHALYRSGESGALSSEEKAAHAAITQTYETEDVLTGYVLENFQVEPGNRDLWLSTTEILNVLHSPGGANLAEGGKIRLSMALSKTLTALGLERKKRRENGPALWGWLGISRKV